MRTFTRYASSYDLHVGTKSISDLAIADQDELLRALLSSEADVRSLVLQHDVVRRQVDGLWAIVVAIGSQLEAEEIVDDAPSMDDEARETILEQLEGTNLGLRLEDVEEPFETSPSRIDFDWKEVEQFAPQGLDGGILGTDDPIELLQSRLSRPVPDSDGFLFRMPHQEMWRRYQKGLIEIWVDRPSATRIYGSSRDKAATILPVAFLILTVAAPIAAIVLSLTIGIAWGLVVFAICAAAAIWSKNELSRRAVKAVREEVLVDRDLYRSLLARRVVWMRVRGGRRG